MKRASPPLIVWMHVAATFLMRYVPVDVAHALVGWVTPLALVFAPGHVRHAMANMRQVLGPSAEPGQVRRVTLAAFRNYARYMVDLVRLASADPRELVKDVVFDGWEHVERAYQHGRGVVVVGGHVGSWDLGAAIFVARGFGLEGVTVRSPADLAPIAAWLDRGATPALVADAKVVPTVVAEWLEEAFRGH